jgi:hypothetical protein
MIPYYAIYTLLLLCIVTGLAFDRLRVAVMVAVVPMAIMIVCRGLVGVDTAFYVFLIDTIRAQGWLSVAIEPGFTISTDILSRVVYDSRTLLAIYGGVAAIIVVGVGLKLERNPVFLCALILPYFLFDMTMNGIRYGLAFALVSLATVFLLAGRRLIFVALCVVAVSIQITSVLLAVGIWTLVERRIRTFLVVFVLVSLLSVYFGAYVLEKASSNADLLPPSSLSGIVPLALTFAMLSIFSMTGEPFVRNKLPVGMLIGAALGAFLMSRVYYAGLRIQALILYLTYIYCVSILYQFRESIRWATNGKLLIVALAILSSAARLKNFSDDRGFGVSPFAPYYFVWDES